MMIDSLFTGRVPFGCRVVAFRRMAPWRGAVLVWLSLVTSLAAQVTTLYIDAYDKPASNAWNRVNFLATGNYSNLVDSTAAAIPVWFQVTSKCVSYNSASANPPTGDAAEFAPAGQTQCYGQSTPSVAIVRGLDPACVYSFTFYASRIGVSDNRDTRFAAVGGNGGTNILAVANNTSQVAVVPYIRPTAAGEITITIDKGPANNSGYFFFLGMKIEGFPTEETLTITGSPSAIGAPIPPYGITNNLDEGDAFQILVPSAATNEAFTATYQGYELWNLDPETGERDSLVDQGSTAAIDYLHGTVGRELILFWTNLVSQATASVAGSGTVTVTPASFPYGVETQVVFTAAPAAGEAFFRWYGDDVPYARDRGTNLVIMTSQSVELQARFGTALYVNAASNTPAPDGSPAAPYAVIQHALDAAPDYATVFVAPGTYYAANDTTNTVASVFGRVALRALEGGAATRISAYKSSRITRRPLAVANDEAYVSGFSLTNGYDNSKLWYGTIVDLRAGVVENCIIPHGDYMWVGMDVYVRGSGCLRNCILDGKVPPSGLFEEGLSHRVYIADNGVVENCLIRFDSTGDVIGGITPVYIHGNGATLRNCLVVDNRIGPGYLRYPTYTTYAAVYLREGTVEHCTIANNQGDRGCAGLSISSSANAAISSVRNCIIQGSRGVLSDADIEGKTSLISYSLCPDLEDGLDGNIRGRAVFVDEASGDFRLRACSPGVDAGIISDVGGTTDYSGHARVAGAAPDMGAYEFMAEVTPECVIDADAGVGRAPFTAVFHARHAGFDGMPDCLWTFGDGATAEGATVQHTYASPGVYTVSLSVTNAAAEVGAVAVPKQILAVPETVYVATNGQHVAPFATPATACTNLQEALDLRPATVRVAAGVYTATQHGGFSLVNGSGTHLVGEDAETTILVANPSYTVLRRTLQIMDPDSVVEGVTLQGANQTDYRANGDPGVAYLYAGTLRNSRTTGPMSTYRSAGIRAENDAHIENCIFGARFTASNTGSGAANVTFLSLNGNAVADRCVVSNTYASGQAGTPWSAVILNSAGATLRNSLITLNNRTSHAYSGAVMVYGSGNVENCTIVSNAFYSVGSGLLITNVTSSSSITCRNNIVWDNILTSTTGTTSDSGVTYPVYHSHSCAPELADSGNGNLAADPLLTPDYRLSANSLCLNAGEKLDWITPEALDLDGLPRLRNGRPDMGAYERQVTTGSILIIR